MMGGLLGGALAGGVGDYFQFAAPGVLAVAMLFGIESTMMAVTTDAARTITDRLRSLPINAAAILAGRCMADMMASVLGLLVTVGAGMALGWRPAGAPALLAGMGLLLWFRFGLLWVGLWAGLRAKGPEVVAAVQILVWPISLLSSVFVNPSTMPTWLAHIAEWNPLSITATAVREVTGSPTFEGTTQASEHGQLLALVVPLAFVVVFAPLAVATYRRVTR